MAKVNVMAVLLLIGLSFVTSDTSTITVPSWSVAGVETSSDDEVTSAGTVEIGPTTEKGPGDDLSTTSGDWTETTENGQTTGVVETTHSEDETTAGAGVTTSSQDAATTVAADTTPSPVGETTEVAETTPSPVGETTEAAETTPSPVGETTEVAETTPSAVGETTEVAETTPSPVGETTEAAETTPSPVGETTEVAETTPSPVEATTEAAETTPSLVGKTTEAAETTPSPVGETTEAAETTPSPVVATTEAAETTPSPVEATTEAAETTPSPVVATTEAAETTPSPVGATTEAGETTPSPDGTTTEAAETTPSPDGATTEAAETTPSPVEATTEARETTPSPVGATTGAGETTPSPDGATTGAGETTPSPDGATTGAGETTPSPDGATTGAGVTSTPPVTTRVTTPVVPTTFPPTIPPNYQPPNFGAAPPFNVTFDIGFNKEWSDNYTDGNCPNSPDCLLFKSVVEKEINKAFVNCSGYKSNSVKVISFRQGSEITQQQVQSSMYMEQIAATNANTENYTYATYNTSFEYEQILSDSAAVINDIETDVVNNLQNADFDGFDALNESLATMGQAAYTQIIVFTLAACPTIGQYVCPSCFPCSEDPALNYTISCHNSCSENEICTLAADETSGCTCKDNYLPVAGDCVDQNIIIGVSAGVGGAILLGLLIALIVVGCKLDKKGKDYDHLKKTQEYRPAPYEVPKAHDTEKAVDYVDIEHVRHIPPGHDGPEMELTTFTNVVEADATPVVAAAAVHAGQHLAVDVDSHKGNGSVAARNGHVKEEKPDYDNPASYSVATAAKADMKPSSSSHQQPKASNHYEGLYYDDPLSEEDPYAGFVPRLTTVDTKNEYIIARPKLDLQPSSNFKDINSQFF